MTLVRIGKSPLSPPRTPAARAADRFFSLGMLAGFVGSVVLGGYLWLLLAGQLPWSGSYSSLKAAHAYVQIFFFLGTFILGFLLQAAPKLFESSEAVAPWAKWLFPALVAAVLLLHFGFPSRVITAAVCAGAGAALLPVARAADPAAVLRTVVHCMTGVFSLAIGALGGVERPLPAIVFLWWGVVSVIFGVAQHFSANILGGRKLLPVEAVRHLSLVGAAGGAILFAATFELDLFFRLFGCLALAAILYFLLLTESYRGVRTREPFAPAFLLAWGWGAAGAVVAVLYGFAAADAVLHLWSVGFATTLVIAVSSRVISMVTEREVLPPKVLLGALLLWQTVPIGRGFRGILPLPSFFSWAVVLASLVVFVLWIGGVGRSILTMVKRTRDERGVGTRVT